MKLKSSYKYQLLDNRTGVIIFYGVILLLTAFSAIMFALKFSGSSSEGTFIGTEGASMIFLFVAGLNSFKENFLMLNQNGVSRKTIFASRLLVTFTLAAVFAVIDKILDLLIKFIYSFQDKFIQYSLYDTVYSPRKGTVNAFQFELEGLFFSLFLYLFALCVGYFITIMFYRLSKGGKIAVAAGVPVLFSVVLPTIDELWFHGQISSAFVSVLDFLLDFSLSNPFIPMLTFFIGSIVLSLITWLLVRRAEVKE